MPSVLRLQRRTALYTKNVPKVQNLRDVALLTEKTILLSGRRRGLWDWSPCEPLRCFRGHRRRRRDEGRVGSSVWHAGHHPADEHIDDVVLEQLVGRHLRDQLHGRVIRVHDRRTLQGGQQDTVEVASFHNRGFVAGVEDLLVGVHQVVVVVLARAVAGDAVALDDGLDVDIVGWDFAVCQRREERLDARRRFEAVIPRVAHEGDDVVDLALARAFGVVGLAERDSCPHRGGRRR